MQKKICVIGSSGYLGSNIFQYLKKSKDFDIFQYSSKYGHYIEKNKKNVDKFDLLIFAAGIHSDPNSDNYKVFSLSKELIRNSLSIIKKSEKIIFISSFKTSFNTNYKVIQEKNKYNYFNYDSHYGQSKIINEKLFIKYCLKNKKEYLIVCPSHVIGPDDSAGSINNKFLFNILKSNFIFYPKCYISLVDIRNITNFIFKEIKKNQLKNRKVILNDKSVNMKFYIEQIKGNKFFLAIPVSKRIINYIYNIQESINSIFNSKISLISKNRMQYINHNPKTIVNDYLRKFDLQETISDTKKLKLSNR